MLGVGERSLHRFLALLVDKFAPGRQSVGVASLARVLPDMAGDGALGFGVAGARTEQRAGAAARRVGHSRSGRWSHKSEARLADSGSRRLPGHI